MASFLYQHVGSYVTRKMLDLDFYFLFRLKISILVAFHVQAILWS